VATSNSTDDLRQAQLRDQSMGELVKQLADETKTLVKQELDLARAEANRMGEAVVTLAGQELRLAKAEMAEKGRTAGPGFGMIGAAGAAALLALDGVMPNWLAALLVALAWGVAAGALYSMGKSRVEKAGPLVPEQAVETLKEDVQWAKTQIGSDTK
jgi:Putative Actinobacterial Holin-X, holin superfamily III